MNPRPLLSWILVAIQFIALGVLALTGPLIARPWPLLVAEVCGFALLAWAIWSVRHAVPNVFPDVRTGAQFLHHGPYRWIRHPMYAALLLITLPLLLATPTGMRVAAWLLLLADLLFKLRYEEKLLVAHFPEYAAYQQTSRRLIPFIY